MDVLQLRSCGEGRMIKEMARIEEIEFFIHNAPPRRSEKTRRIINDLRAEQTRLFDLIKQGKE